MMIAVVGYKGGTGKTVTAIHLANYFQRNAPTLLVDGDANRSALAWSKRGSDSLPFKIVSETQAAKYAKDYEHVVFDTEARPDTEDLQDLAEMCDVLVLPSVPDAVSLDALLQTVTALREIGAKSYRALLCITPPRPSRDADDARELLADSGVEVFDGQIHRLVAFQKAALAGTTVDRVADPRASVAWSDYESIGKQIVNGGR